MKNKYQKQKQKKHKVNNFTEIVCILDRSGSMDSVANDAIGGFNTFLKEQQKMKGKANITTALFDHEYILLHDNVDIQNIPELNKDTYIPRGMTRLNDAIGRTLTTITERIEKTKEKYRPNKVVVAILTDGYENDSKEFNTEKIKEMITKQEKENKWEFIYLGANQDAFAVGSTYGFHKNNSINFNSSDIGTRCAFANVTNYVKTIRTVGNARKFKLVSEDQIKKGKDGYTEILNNGE